VCHRTFSPPTASRNWLGTAALAGTAGPADRYDAVSYHYAPVGWGDAFALIASERSAVETPNEAAFMYQLFGRRCGTNNLPDCSNMWHETTNVGLVESIGIGKGTVLLEDFEHTDAIFVIGQNPGTNSPRMLTDLRKAARRGVPVVVINPLREHALERFRSTCRR
jgi:anaerobic selenocysteine-containing dehydrogenase